MLPTLEIGPWRFSTHILTYVLAAFAAGAFSFLRLKRLGISGLVRFRLVLVVTVSGFACSYLVRLLPTIQRYIQTGVWDWVNGSSYIGALLGGIIVLVLYYRRCCRQDGAPVGRVLDLALPTLALGAAIGRLGCLAAGCCYGKPTGAWPRLFLPDQYGDWAYRYPTQLLSIAANLIVLALLLAIERRYRTEAGYVVFDGFVALLYLDLYLLARFALEFLRADAIAVWGPISWAQLYTVAGMILFTAWLAWKRTKAPAPSS